MRPIPVRLLPCACALVCLAGVAIASESHPADTRIGNVLCTVSAWLVGNTGQGVATLAMTGIGIWNLLGKISGRIAFLAAIGVAVLFGAPQIVASLGAGVTDTTCAIDGR